MDIFYNRRRIHEANGCLTPEEYYDQHRRDSQAAWLLLDKSLHGSGGRKKHRSAVRAIKKVRKNEKN